MVCFTLQFSIVLLLLLSAMTFYKGICSTNVKLNCNGEDRSTLLIFKHGVVDRSNKLSSWSNEEDCCAWKGVQCDNVTGRVTRLDLNREKLEGEIDLSLLQIEFLTFLNLSLNGFTGLSLPKTFNQSYATLSNLKYLDLSFNEDLHLNDLQWLSHLSSLQWLNLSEINLENIETNWLQTMAMHSSLSDLRLASCHLNNISPSVKFVNFTSLVSLDLSGNYFDSNLPYWLFNISSDISHIDLSSSTLQGQIPKSLLNLRNLKSLRLDNNELTGPIPNWLGEHEHLQHLGLTHNLFYGSFPSSLGNLTSLTELGISSDLLTGNLSNTIGQLFNLRSLFIGGSLSGVLSDKHFSKLFNLESLFLISAFAFDLNPNWIPPFQLHQVSLRNTILGPTFPEWLYTQRTLETLDVSKTGISSINVDKFWSFVANIREISLSNNAISADLSNVTLNSEYINMDNNNFRGGLPRISTNVFHFDIFKNSLSGPISSLLCSKLGRGKNRLNYLDVSDNLLTGVIPDCWGNWTGLTILKIGRNKLVGEIPSSMGSLNELILISLPSNNLSGIFSLDMSNFKSLAFIDLGENHFSGAIPTIMPDTIRVISFRSNHFSGNIPTQLCSLPSLWLLDLSQNELSGSIPPCTSNITFMVDRSIMIYYPLSDDLFFKGWEMELQEFEPISDLDLSTNHLSGEIPPELFNLTQLMGLNLSGNLFIGNISSNIGGMENLEFLDLSNNHLSGDIPAAISNLSSLGLLNLSFNNFSGPIPLGIEIQVLDNFSYIGNPNLCGPPLTKICSDEVNRDKTKQGGANGSQNESLYLGMGVGYVVGLSGFWYSLLLSRAWRHKYFDILDHILDWLYVFVALKLNKFGEFIAGSR